MLVGLPTLSDPTITVGVEATQVCALEPVPGGGTRISLSRGTSESTSEPYVFVQGTVLAIAALIIAPDKFGILVPFLDLSGQTVTVNPLKVTCVEQASPTTSRISIERPASQNTDGPFLIVQGTVIATITALDNATPQPFGAEFATAAAGAPVGTSSAVLVPIAGTLLPAVTVDGDYMIQAFGMLTTSNAAANGATAQILKNGVPFGTPISVPVAGFVAGETIPFFEYLIDAAIPGDVYQLAFAAVPGAGADVTTITGAVLSRWLVA